MGVLIAVLSILGTIVIPITLVIIVKMGLKDEKHRFYISLDKSGFKVIIEPITTYPER
nr:MAG TPA: hypothetical protein [Caudoviricetes sp.]